MDQPLPTTRPKKQLKSAHSIASAVSAKVLSTTDTKSVVRKKVRFEEGPPAVFEYELHDEINEDNPDSEDIDNATTVSRKTSEMTVLSSDHGRARRKLRDITKHNLQTCVKYGIKKLGRPHPRTGEKRWLYCYDDVTYVTDSTSRIEVEIERATVNCELQCRHDDQVAALRDDPMICTTHSIIIIDQSGSMREADVQNFRSRSHAAYGVLALEYIAEQLHERAEDDGTIDTVTIIEMHDIGSFYVRNEPLDWILFNKLLDRQVSAQPSSHGNYNSALELAQSHINDTLNKNEDMVLEDMPSFALIFLTDGKPSDKTPYDGYVRSMILQEIASQLGSKLTFKAIGLGPSGHDFSVLSEMASSLRMHGVDASFDFAHRCTAMLGETLSSVATSMTKTRDTLLSSAVVPRLEKAVSLRDRYMPKADRRFTAYTNAVSRWCLDRKKDDEGDDWPWRKRDFFHRKTEGFEMEDHPFGKGRERLAYTFFEIDFDGKRVGKSLVAKESLAVEDSCNAVNFHLSFCRDQATAHSLAQKFNSIVSNCELLAAGEGGSKAPSVTFLECSVYEYTTTDEIEEGLLVESFLKGKFIKFNGNDGFVRRSATGDKQISLAIGTVLLTDFLHAFSHWTYVETEGNRLVCDLQGVLNEEGRHPKFELTDPCICNRTTKGRRRKGMDKGRKTDLGMWGIRRFLNRHKCNKVCEALGLHHRRRSIQASKIRLVI